MKGSFMEEGMEKVSLSDRPVDLKAVGRIPWAMARKYHVLPIGMVGGTLVVAMDDPLNFYAQEEVNLAAGGPVHYVLAGTEEIIKAIDSSYTELEVQAAVEAVNRAVSDSVLFDKSSRAEDETPIIRLLNGLLLRGYRNNASDIHVEPQEKELVIRMRVDGLLTEYIRLKKEVHLPLITRAKILSGLDIAEKRLPQDGHCKTEVQNQEMNLRVSTVPTIYGEKMVLRFLNTDITVDREDTFGMDEADYQKLLDILKRPEGIVYFTGPTGSGKTTTLYMILERMKKNPVNIMTIEDPVEKNIPGINQIQINEQAGLTFEKGLRAILRQDPDIIMIGETRDALTAKISVRAAITGHLVLSTLHTSDAAGAITRMLDMGVEPFMAADSLSGVVAQRLARKICPHCAKEVPAGEWEKEILGKDTETVYCGTGCHFCSHTGYKGRIAVHEVIVIDKPVREMIMQRKSVGEIREYVRNVQSFRSLKENLVGLARQGVISAAEVLRLTYGEE